MKIRESMCVVMLTAISFAGILNLGSPNASAAYFGTEEYRDLAIDDDGNVYVCGFTESYGDGGYDIILAKYDINGDLCWRNFWGNNNPYSPNDDMAYGIAIDDEFIYIVGCTNQVTIGDNGDFDIFVLKYDLDGNEINDEDQDDIFEWPKWLGTVDSEIGLDVAIDASYVYILGVSPWMPDPESADMDIMLYKFSKDGNQQPWSYPIVWDSGLSPAADDVGYSICVDEDNIYVAGYTGVYGDNDADALLISWDKQTGGYPISSGGGSPRNGFPVYWGGNWNQLYTSIVEDISNGYLYCGGMDDYNGVALINKYDLSGNGFLGWPVTFENQLPGSSYDYFWGIAYDSVNEKIWVTGESEGWNGNNPISKYLNINYNINNDEWEGLIYFEDDSRGSGHSIGIYSYEDDTYLFSAGTVFRYGGTNNGLFDSYHYDAAVYKWQEGQQPEWTVRFGQSLFDIFNGCANLGGGFYVVGTTDGFGSSQSGSEITKDGFISYYYNAENPPDHYWAYYKWVTIDYGGVDVLNGIVVDENECCIYVVGYTADIDDENKDVIVAKYDTDLNNIWTRIWDNYGDEWANAVAVDDDYVYITGCGNYNQEYMGLETFILKYDKDGNLQTNDYWPVTSIMCNYDDSGNAIALGTGIVYVAGYYSSSTDKDIDVLARLKSTGAVASYGPNTWDGQDHGDDCANSIFVQGDNVYISGYTYNEDTGLDIIAQKRIGWNSAPTWTYIDTRWEDDDEANSIIVHGDPARVFIGGKIFYGSDQIFIEKLNENTGALICNDGGGGTYTDGIKSLAIIQEPIPGYEINEIHNDYVFAVGWSYDTRYNDDGSMDGLMALWDTSLYMQSDWPMYWG